MDHSVSTGPPVQPAPVQQKANMQAPLPQTQQQIAQYPPPQANVQREDLVPFSRPWHIAKLVLGTASIICSIVIFGTGIYFYTTAYTFRTAFQFGMVAAAAGLALVWQTAEFITVCASSRHRGIHPGANVALHLIIWLIAACALSFMAVYVAIDQYDIDDGYDYSSYGYYYDDYYSDSLSWIKTVVAVEEAMLAFTVLLFLIHFTLFVRACVETHQYNRATRTIFVPMPMGQYGYYPPGPPMQQYPYGMQPVPQQQMVQPQPQMPEQIHHYGYYAPAAHGAVEVPSNQLRDQPRGSTISTASPPPGQQIPRSVSPGTNSDYQRT